PHGSPPERHQCWPGSALQAVTWITGQETRAKRQSTAACREDVLRWCYQPPPPPPPPPPPEDPPPPDPEPDEAGADADETALENELLKDEGKPAAEKVANPAPSYQEGEYPARLCPDPPAAAPST